MRTSQVGSGAAKKLVIKRKAITRTVVDAGDVDELLPRALLHGIQRRRVSRPLGGVAASPGTVRRRRRRHLNCSLSGHRSPVLSDPPTPDKTRALRLAVDHCQPSTEVRAEGRWRSKLRWCSAHSPGSDRTGGRGRRTVCSSGKGRWAGERRGSLIIALCNCFAIRVEEVLGKKTMREPGPQR